MGIPCWVSAAQTMNEHERIKALKRYEILDTPPEREFDDITHLAAQICETPIALISLVDEKRQWFKSTLGLELRELPRDISFCAHAILGGDLFEVFDASKDERFLTNPLVTGEPHIRFYAGAPLVTPDGQSLGTLCVTDYSPRKLSEEQRDGLKRLAAQVVRQLEVRHDRMQLIRNTEELRESNERTEQIIAAALDAVITMGMDGLIVSWNPQAETIFGWSAGEVIGKRMSEVIIPPSQREAHERGLSHLAKTGEARVLDRRLEMTALNKEGKEFPIELTISRVQVSGQPFFSGFIRDLSAVKEAEANLKRTSQLLSAVGQLQSGYISRDHAGAAETFDALLQLLLKFTDSEYGFVAEVLRDENGDPYLKTHAITNIAWNDEMRAFYEEHKAAGLEFRNLKTLFGAALVTGETVISNDPSTDPRRGGLPPGHPPMDSFLGVPIKQGEEIIGMVGVSNRPGGYDPEIVEEIDLLFSTYATIIRGFQFAKQQQADQQRIEALNLNLEARAADLADALDMNRRVERERRDALEE
ncbi:MAG: GAF domain-containing protein, partial [Akkermansiaceae bacterium]|nr:GAF domain-containing protein [Akkermansiaceae bacterium]